MVNRLNALFLVLALSGCNAEVTWTPEPDLLWVAVSASKAWCEASEGTCCPVIADYDGLPIRYAELGGNNCGAYDDIATGEPDSHGHVGTEPVEILIASRADTCTCLTGHSPPSPNRFSGLWSTSSVTAVGWTTQTSRAES